MEERTGRDSSRREDLRSGWCLGSASFRERILRLLDGNATNVQTRELDGSMRRSHGEEHALRLLQKGLEIVSLSDADLAALKKNDPCKSALAAVIRSRTSVPNAWIATHLHLRHLSRVSRCYAQRSDLRDQLDKALADN